MPVRNEAVIRVFTKEDDKLARFMVSKSNFQMLAVANFKTTTHPIMIAIWLALSSVMIQYLQWWPTSKHGWLEFLKPLPSMAAVAVPLMFGVDWINRPDFEDLTKEILRRDDLKDIQKHYNADAASGFFLLELGETFIGLIAIDASQPSRKPAKGETRPPKTAIIRHFHIEEAYKKVNIQRDLLKCAVDHAFTEDPKLQRIEASDSPLAAYLRPCLREAGFELDHHTTTVGILRWKLGTRVLERKTWEEKAKGEPTVAI